MMTVTDHSKVEKPWGNYKTVFLSGDKSVCFKVLQVDPGHQLSLQYHNKRNEFWYIADKDAYYQMTINDKVEITHGIRSFNIIRGQLHTILNMSSLPLIIYETQTGYCDESDIVRVKDPYANCRSVP